MTNFSFVAVVAGALCLAGCETPTTQRYAISAENNAAIKALSVNGIGVSAFQAPPDFSAVCRALGPLEVADGMTHTQYIQKAFEDELKLAGAFALSNARVTLKGKINALEFSSSHALTSGYWDIDLGLSSSNGAAMSTKEHYEFSSGFIATEACRNTAEAFERAVQNLVGKAVKSPEFVALVK